MERITFEEKSNRASTPFVSLPKIEDRIKVVRREIRKMQILFPKSTRAQNSEQFRTFKKNRETTSEIVIMSLAKFYAKRYFI